MSIFTALTTGGGADAIGTTFPVFRVGLLGPTFYTGTADPTITPPNPMDDGLNDGDIYVRTTGGGAAIWVYDTAAWTQIASGAGGGSFAGDIVMLPGAQFLGDDAAGSGAPAYAFDGDPDTGMFQGSANELSFATGGTERFIIEADGTLASTTAGYETLVLADNDIPNRKYVEDTFINGAGDSMTGDLTFDPGTQLFIASGSALDPGIAFALDSDNGFYLDGVNSVGVSSGGAEIANFNTDGIQMRNGAQFIGDTGSAATPSYSFNGDLDTGIFHDGTNGEIAFSSNTVETIAFDGTAANGSLLWQGGDGDATTPGISFSGDNNTGFFSSGSGEISYSSDGSDVLSITGTAVDTSLRWLGQDGTAAAPAVSFSAEDDGGMYRVAANLVGFAAGGTETLRLASTNLQALDGLEATPSYSFRNQTDTGMYLFSATALGFSVGSNERVRFTTTANFFEQQIRTAEANGNAASPSFSFSTDADTGMYQNGANILAFATGSTGRWQIEADGDFMPIANNTYDIGSSGVRVATVYATTFDGTATAAQYSDLAERYTVGDCCKLEPGDVVVICEHDDHDICLAMDPEDDRVLGVVSTNPAFMMNKDAGDADSAPYIALGGRVPVKVCGIVKKGDLLVTCGIDGCARAIKDAAEKLVVSPHAVFAKALSAFKPAGPNSQVGEVEAVIL